MDDPSLDELQRRGGGRERDGFSGALEVRASGRQTRTSYILVAAIVSRVRHSSL